MASASNPRRTRAQWSALIKEQALSNETLAQFCEHRGITISNFYAWKSKLTKQTPADSTPEHHLTQDGSWIALPTAKTDEQSYWDIELALPGGVVLRMRES